MNATVRFHAVLLDPDEGEDEEDKSAVGSYPSGIRLSTVPFQQYRWKHVWQASGSVVPVRLNERERIAQPMQVGHSLSWVALAMVTTSYPLVIIESRSSSE